jgi:HlyD family secretion protein
MTRWWYRYRRAAFATGAVLGLAAVGAGVIAYWASLRRGHLDDLTTVVVRRAPLQATVVEDGEFQSAERTTVECKLEAVGFRNAGRELRTDGSSVIIELVPQGTLVQKGDVLCRLASSDYEELVRLQEIEYQEDAAECRAARLDVERHELALREYREGIQPQTEEQLLGAIRLAEADAQRQADRVLWSQEMADLGYVPPGRLAAEQVSAIRFKLALEQAERAYENFVRFKAPAAIAQLQGQLDRARTELSFQEGRLRRNAQQLAKFQEQVERCTIRAPHAGYVIYARQRDDIPLELGTTVRRRQDLFYLPNLDKMEVHAELHETVLDRVRPGMPAMVRAEAFPNAVMKGEVIAVAPLPIQVRSRYQTEVKSYVGRVRLESIPRGLLPGMTARVEILTDSKPDALLIPPTAMVIEEGQPVCYVADGEAFQRREIEIGACLPDRLEVLAGLSEGERVVATPHLIDTDLLAPPAGSPASHAMNPVADAPQPTL